MSGISFVVNARSSLAIVSSVSEPELLLLKQFWRSHTTIELSGNNIESFFAGAGNEQLKISIFAPRIF